jgi:dynein heavy chain
VLTTVLQSYARKHGGVSIDALAIETEVLKKSSAEITHGAGKGALYVAGLYLEGAAWDARANTLTDPPPRQSAVALPVVALRAVPAETQQTRGIYWAPVYATRARGSSAFVQVIGLRTNDPQSLWVLRGVAVLLDNTAGSSN